MLTMPDLATDFDASETEHIARQLGPDACKQLSAVYQRQRSAFLKKIREGTAQAAVEAIQMLPRHTITRGDLERVRKISRGELRREIRLAESDYREFGAWELARIEWCDGWWILTRAGMFYRADVQDDSASTVH
jgi:hypothetical protein